MVTATAWKACTRASAERPVLNDEALRHARELRTRSQTAIAILDDQGSVVFAEATERHLQSKRAIGCPADPIVWSLKVIEKYCDPSAEFHIATSWSKRFVTTLNLFNFFGFLNQNPDSGASKLFRRLMKAQLPDHNMTWMFRKMVASNIQTGSTFERNLRVNFNVNKIANHRFDHHLCHAASGVYASGFDDALCLVVDGMGEKGGVSYYTFSENGLHLKGTHVGPESLGFFYVFITHLCDFEPLHGEEWKVMGLAAYGKENQKYRSLLDELLSVSGSTIKAKSGPARVDKIFKTIHADINTAEDSFQRRADLAHTGQQLFTEYMLSLINNIQSVSTSNNLVFAGGCALNSSFNGKVVANTRFENLYVPSAPGDDGTSLGAAYLAFKKDNPGKNPPKALLSPYLGSEITDKEIEGFINFSGYEKVRRCPGAVHLEAAKLLAQGKLIGWAQGRAEFGPRSLGNRAILADPRTEQMKETINARVKFREEFRPFAPSILAEYGEAYFENYQQSPYMERTLRFREEVKSTVPAVVHVDGTGRLQTVRKEWNEKYHQLISAFHELTGVPVILNTSFNVMGKPIIHSFNDALTVFFNSGLDALVVNDYVIYK